MRDWMFLGAGMLMVIYHLAAFLLWPRERVLLRIEYLALYGIWVFCLL